MDNIIINSKKELILFYLSSLNNIQYTIYDFNHILLSNQSLCEDKVLNFTATIDNDDVIHIVLLIETGELNYYILNDQHWTKSVIAKFNFKSNIYNNLYLFAKNNNINLFYSYANLINDKLWTIQHIIGNFNSWKKFNVINYIANKKDHFLYLDQDSFGTIHLIYSSNNNNRYQIYHTFYNSFTERWNQYPYRLSDINFNNILPYLFIDSKDNLHGLWLEGNIDKNILKYAQFPFKPKGNYSWKQINIPLVFNCTQVPIMIEENGKLKIIYTTKDNISFLYSMDYGKSWIKGNSVDVNGRKLKLAKISKNITSSKNNNINNAYFSNGDNLNFYFVDTLQSLKNYSNSSNCTNGSMTQQKFNNQNEKIDVEEIKTRLNEIHSSQEAIEKNIEKILDILSKNKPSLLNKFRLFNK